MKTGKSLTELATELERQQEAKQDVVVDTRALEMVTYLDSMDNQTNRIELKVPGTTYGDPRLPITRHAHHQIADRIKIPTRYYDRMKDEAPQLLAQNVNHWFQDHPERRLVRTLDGKARAFLSDRYQRVDNWDVAQMVLPVLLEGEQDIQIVSCELTERKMYIKAVTPKLRREVKVGDEVQAGVVISNSEIGQGAILVQPLIYRLICLNGMTVNDAKLRKHHVGARADLGDEMYGLLSDETLKADDKAIMLKVRDVVKASMDDAFFNKTVDRMIESTSEKLEGNPAKAVEVLANKTDLSEAEGGGILRSLIEGGDTSRYGVINAVTAFAQTVESYDRSTELEALGGKILDLPRQQWEEIAQAA